MTHQRYVPEETMRSTPSCKNPQSYEANLWLFTDIWIATFCASNLPSRDKEGMLYVVTNNAFVIYLLPSSSDINCIGRQNTCYNQFRLFFTFHSMNKRFAFNRGSLLKRYYWILVCNFTGDLQEINFDLPTSSLNLWMLCTYGFSLFIPWIRGLRLTEIPY
jgi:hypothetical protein